MPRIVLDTNAVFDWLVFRDPAMHALGAAIVAGRVQWVATAAMHDEFRHVLARGLAAERGANSAGLHAAWHGHAVEHADAPRSALHCTDGDDQKFLDLARATGAAWLVSRDRALLRLKRRAAAMGLAIVQPAEWRPE